MRIKATVAYDGASFHGFATNPGVRTVGGELSEALSRCLRQVIKLTCAGRTDTGVHAQGQVVSFDVCDNNTANNNLTTLRNSVNKMLAPTIAIREMSQASDTFDARLDAQSRTYRYTLLNSEVHDPLLANTTWHHPRSLDITAMNEAAQHLLGEHDFSSFCRRQHSRDGTDKSRIRQLLRAQWADIGGELLQFEIEASSFCQQMVRSIVGTLIDIGTKRWPPETMSSILAAKNRSHASNLAPARGLCLWAVTYPQP
ncbi:MAG: tRNA pseudouridine(38-40) synthase TruA [Acidimicrobiia bacterium]|nr:tRNA pseudouridine(38-40) synthase TruA [Acidimicrobiia bacterium]